jgi:two-component system LytT family response regulator
MRRAIKKSNFLPSDSIQYKVLRDNLSQQQDKKVVLQTSETIYVVNQDDIIFIQAEGSYTKIVTVTHGVLTITKKLLDFEYLETDGPFFRTHRIYLVNLNHVKKIDKKDFVLIMSNEAQVHLAQDKKNQLIERFTI